jgi:hypothetical protein
MPVLKPVPVKHFSPHFRHRLAPFQDGTLRFLAKGEFNDPR